MILIISGKTCSGKSTLAKHLIENGGFGRIVTCTTRQPREGEKNGVHYHFLAKEQFSDAINKDEFIEFNVHGGVMYGVRKKEIIQAIDAPSDSLIVIEPVGRRKLVKYLQGNQMRYLSIYLDISSVIQAERFMNRIQMASANELTDLTDRMASMLEVEQNWLKSSTTDGSCDMVFASFNTASDLKHVTDIIMQHVMKKPFDQTEKAKAV
ncbi:guanylate kinase [Acinetobacter baumannii]